MRRRLGHHWAKEGLITGERSKERKDEEAETLI